MAWLRSLPALGILRICPPAICLVLVACGNVGGGASPADGGHPSGSEAGNEASTTSDGGFDGAVPAPGAGTLAGPQAFPVGSAIEVFSAEDCSGNTFADAGALPAVNVFFLPPELPATDLCTVDAGVPDASSSIVALQVATAQWATYAPGPLTQSLTPGTYQISNEHQDDEDLCMLAGGGTAILLIYPPGGESQWVAASGTVSLATISPASVTGSFDVVLTPEFAGADASSPTLSGTFNAVPCP